MFGESIFSQGDKLSFQRIVQEAILNHGTNPIVVFNVVRAAHAVGNVHYQHKIEMVLDADDRGLPTDNPEILKRILDGKQPSTCIFKDDVIGTSTIGLYYSGVIGKYYYLVLTENTKTMVVTHVLTDNPEAIAELAERFKGITPVCKPPVVQA